MMNNLLVVCSVLLVFWLCGGFRRMTAYLSPVADGDPCEHFVEPPQ